MSFRKKTVFNDSKYHDFVENDNLNELFYDPSAKSLSQFEYILKALGINYNKNVYDIFVLILRYIVLLGIFGFATIYVGLMIFYAINYRIYEFKVLSGALALVLLVLYFCF